MIKLLASVEELLYQVLLWIALWPKTLVHWLAYPGRLPAYIDAELAKPEAERFEDYVSPMLFLALCILPLLLFEDMNIVGRHSLLAWLNVLGAGHGLESGILLIAGVFLLPPLVASIVSSILCREALTRGGLRPRILVQTYLWGSLTVFNLPWSAILRSERISRPIFGKVVLGVTVTWWLLAQLRVFLNSGLPRRAAVVHATLVVVAVGGVLYLPRLWYLFLAML